MPAEAGGEAPDKPDLLLMWPFSLQFLPLYRDPPQFPLFSIHFLIHFKSQAPADSLHVYCEAGVYAGFGFTGID